MSDNPAAPNTKSLLKSALLELESMQAALRRAESAKTEPIAVIGLSCRFPGGAGSPEAYWRLLESGKSGVCEIPADRFAVDDYYHPDRAVAGKIYTRYGAFLDRIADFDPQFFGISGGEAGCLDPQQRLLLETSWEAFENAHLPPEKLFGSNTGVFIGTSSFEYASRLSSVPAESITAYFGTGGALSAAAGRLSYSFGFSGPSMTFDTACSSSLVALHQAVLSLRSRETDLALAGGVNLLICPQVYVTFCKAGMLAPDGRCKTFDAAADGFVRGEGCGVVALKRLSDAVSSGNRILALIRGSAVNQDGASGGFTVPSGPSQDAVIRRALASAGLNPAAIDYVETHGTGTSLGDPIEIGALGSVFGKQRSADRSLLVGSVKTNIGHLEGAAGIAGVIKVILSLLHEVIPPHLHYRDPNPYIPWNHLPVKVAAEGAPWPRGSRRRLAGVSSFGFTGTNAHVVLEEAPPEPARHANISDRPVHLLTLSAKTPKALAELALLYAARLESDPSIVTADFCFSASQGRSHFPFRWGIVGSSPAILAQRLCERTDAIRTPNSPGQLAVFCSSADGDPADRAAALYESSPVFQAAWTRCEDALQRKIPFHPSSEAAFATSFALVELWKSYGIKPSVFLGAGIGRQVARVAARLCSLEEALNLALAPSTEGPIVPIPDGLAVILVAGPSASVLSPSPATSVIQGGCDWDSLLSAMAKLYEAGFPIDWESYDRPYSRNWIDLPTYPFQRQRHWIDLAPQAPATPSHPLLGRLERLASGRLQWESTIGSRRPVYLEEHRVYGRTIVPAAAFLEMALSAGTQFLSGSFAVADVIFHQALLLPGDTERRLRLSVDKTSADSAQFEISSAPRSGGDDTLHCSGTIAGYAPAFRAPGPAVRIEGTPLSVAEFYRRNAERKLDYGLAFQGVEELWAASGEAWGRIRLPEPLRAGRLQYKVHPALLDACFQVLGAALPNTAAADDADTAFLPIALSGVVWHGDPGDNVLARVRTRYRGAGGISADFDIFDAAHVLVGEVEGLQFAKVKRESLLPAGYDAFEDLFYRTEWRPKPLSASISGKMHRPTELISHLETQFDPLGAAMGVDRFTAALPLLNQLAAAYASNAIQNAGSNGAGTAALPHYRSLVERLRQIAAQNQGSRSVQELMQSHPECEAELRLVAQCGSRLSEVLSGSLSPLEALFPQGDFSLANRVYETSVGAQMMNGLVREAVSKCVQSLPEGRKLRILEVGAGTGATTAHLLPLLSASVAEYVFTDVSAMFVAQSRKKFGGCEFLHSRILDIEKDPVEQGMDIGFDIVVAVNVLHATADLRTSLRNIRTLLAHRGLLILMEGTSPQNWIDITFGLTEGWWRFTDFDVRPRHPLLAEDRWLALLQEAGFEEAGAASPGSQAVMIARKPVDRPPSGAKSWLILADTSGVAAELARLLVARGETCRVVTNPDFDPQDVDSPSGWRGAVHLCSLDIPPGASPDFDRIWPPGCGSALRLAQHAWSTPFPIWMVTRHAFASAGLAQSPLWGLGKVLALENPALGGIRVELDHEDAGEAAAAVLEEILGGDGELEVLRQGPRRLVSRLVRSHAVLESTTTLRNDATYLITGGLRGLGFRIAEWMVDAGARHLILLGRTAPGEAASARIAALEARGVSVAAVTADVALAEDVARTLQRIPQSHPLRGIVHAATVLQDATIPQQSPDHFRNVFRAKVDGAWNLHRQTLGLDLDFFVLFSSVVSLVGSPGQSNYAAANTFMDSLTEVRRRAGMPGLSIDWGPWSTVGIVADRGFVGKMESRGVQSLDPETGCKAFGALLREGGRVGVVAMDWPVLFDHFPAALPRSFFSEITSAGKAVDHTRVRPSVGASLPRSISSKLAALPAAERQQRLRAEVRDLLSRTIGFPADQLDMSQPLVDAGLDSLLALQLKSGMESELGLRVDLVKLVGGATGADLIAMASALACDGEAVVENAIGHGPQSIMESLAKLDELSEEGVDSLLNSLLQEEREL